MVSMTSCGQSDNFGEHSVAMGDDYLTACLETIERSLKALTDSTDKETQ